MPGIYWDFFFAAFFLPQRLLCFFFAGLAADLPPCLPVGFSVEVFTGFFFF